MTYDEKQVKVEGVARQTSPKKGQTELVVTFTNGAEYRTFCDTEKIDEAAKTIKESLQDVESVKMVENK